MKSCMLKVFIFLGLALWGHDNGLAAVSPDVRSALVDFYKYTNGDDWTNSSGWKVGDPCADSWYGVSCILDYVTEIDLEGNGLTGSVPSTIHDVSTLNHLNLSHNSITGRILPHFGALGAMRELYLNNNQFTGNIPEGIGLLTDLEYLYLAHNQLSGFIPISFKNLINLVDSSFLDRGLTTSDNCLYTDDAELTSFIKQKEGNFFVYRESCPGGMTRSELAPLAALYNATGGENWTNNSGWKSGNPCSDTGDWYGITCNPEKSHIIKLLLYSNNLNGPVPQEISKLTMLEHMFVDHNNLTGPIPPEISQLSNLISLALGSNHLTGPIPPEISQLSNLETLTLFSNDLTGSIPSELSNLDQLTNLSVADNKLTGLIPSGLGKLDQLRTLQVSDNKLTGSIPSKLGNLDQLTILYFEDNKLCGNIPVSLLKLVNLQDNHGIRIGNNFLFTNNPTLDAFLIDKGGEWENSQGTMDCPSFPWPLLLPAITGKQ